MQDCRLFFMGVEPSNLGIEGVSEQDAEKNIWT
jgi:hypothetical protein